MVERGVVKQEQGDLFLPPGFRFHPTDEEVVTSYLLRKFLNPSFDPRAIAEVNLNKCEPRDLPSKAKMGEKEWYFFCHKDMKYPTGVRTNRATKEGYWKATGKDREIFKPVSDGGGGRRELVGMKKTLVFYTGRAPRGSKTNWVMHEFRLEGKYRDTANPVHLTPKDEWVVCKVFHKSNGEDNKKANAAAAAAAGAGDGGDDVLVDSTIDPVCFEYSTSSLLDTTTTTTTMDVTAMAPYDAAAMLTNVVGSFVDDLPNYTLISDTTSSSRRNLHQHQTTTVAGSTAVPASSGYSSPWTTNTLRPEYSYLAMGSYDLLDQAMTAKALGLGGVVSPAVAGGLPSYPVAGTLQQSSLGHY